MLCLKVDLQGYAKVVDICFSRKLLIFTERSQSQNKIGPERIKSLNYIYVFCLSVGNNEYSEVAHNV